MTSSLPPDTERLRFALWSEADLARAIANPGNTASAALLERLGFRYVRDELYPATGLRHPSYLLDPRSPARRAR